ncbi:abortive infection family protein [uncultured Ellagibacter sp.]|uniref:abortive infection family protein n=1 Tax=uncultured Ellagibacter sp. TaxID=2137580 RepID=UPI00261A75E3|nr:abortive infection family protein [uncultured Ellagibacter sp.]
MGLARFRPAQDTHSANRPIRPRIKGLLSQTLQPRKLRPQLHNEFLLNAGLPAGDTVKRILGSLGNIAGGIAVLRSPYGTGHGKRMRQTG